MTLIDLIKFEDVQLYHIYCTPITEGSILLINQVLEMQ